MMTCVSLRNCYLGKVSANAMVTNPFFPKENIDAFINLFKYAQQFYGQKMKNEFSFSMFYSEPPYADLIFSDAAQKIVVLDDGRFDKIMDIHVFLTQFSDKRHYLSYLGQEFQKAFEEVECFSAATLPATTYLSLVLLAMAAVLL